MRGSFAAHGNGRASDGLRFDARMLADAVLTLHVLFVLFVVGGFALILAGARRWGWVRTLSSWSIPITSIHPG